jgi:hypothetical protein
MGMLWRMVMVSSPTRTSLTTSRTMRWRSMTLSVSAGTTQPGKEGCEGLGQAQECNLIVALVSDRLQLSTERLLALTQQRHALA